MATNPLTSSNLFFFFFFFFFLSILSTTIAYNNNNPHPKNHSKKTQNFIYSSCQSTQYPPLCYQTLVGFGSRIGQSQRQLALTALALSLSKARLTTKFVNKIKNIEGINHKEFQAIKDCIDTMSDGVDQLNRSFGELIAGSSGHKMNGQDFMWHMSNVQTWVSAALTDETTCVDGLNDEKSGKIKGDILMRVNSVAQVTSNALALVNGFANRSNYVKKP